MPTITESRGAAQELSELHDPYGELADIVSRSDPATAKTWLRALARARREFPDAQARNVKMRRDRRDR